MNAWKLYLSQLLSYFQADLFFAGYLECKRFNHNSGKKGFVSSAELNIFPGYVPACSIGGATGQVGFST